MLKRLKWHIDHHTGRDRVLEILVSACIGLFLASSCIHWINGALRPQMISLAETRIRNQVTRIANQSVRNALLSQGQKSLTTMDQVGKEGITVLTVDHVLLNELMLSVTDSINDQLINLDQGQLDIPLGSATGMDLLAGLGPGVPVHVLSVASVSADFHSEFQSAGINQTLHRLLLDVEVKTRLLLPGCRTEVTVAAPICISETIIIGAVPDIWPERH